MVSLAGLSAAFPGFQESADIGAQTDLRRQQTQLAKQTFRDTEFGRLGTDLAGQAFPFLAPGMMPGAQPIPGGPPLGMTGGGPFSSPGGAGPSPQPMGPGQGSVPNQQFGPPMPQQQPVGQGADPGSMLANMGERWPAVPSQAPGSQMTPQMLGAPPQQAQMRPPGPPQGMPPQGPQGGPQGMPPGFQGQLGIQDAMAAINRAQPNAPPEIKMRALSQLSPMIRMDDRTQIMWMNALLRSQDNTRKQEQGDRRLDETVRSHLVTEGQTDQRIRIAEDNRQLKAEFKTLPSLNEQAINMRAEMANQGSPDAFKDLGPGNQGAANRAAIANRQAEMWTEQGLSAKEVIARQMQVNGQKAATRTAGTIVGRVTQASNAMDGTLSVARDALKQYDTHLLRSRFPKLNEFINASEEQLGGEDVVRFRNSLQGVINTYARVMGGGYRPSDTARERATERINAGWNTGQLESAFKLLEAEADAELNSNKKTMDLLSKGEYGAQPRGPAGKPEQPPATKGTGKYEGFEIVQ